jgi:hypothetical protein
METAIRSTVVAHGGNVDEHGNITMLPDTPIKLGDTAVAELSRDEERKKAEPMPEAEPEEDELSPRPERPTRH